MQLKKQAASGVKWTTISTVISTILQFLQLAVLARLLSPEAFGLMAMITVVLGLGQAYADMGISNAIIHRLDTTMEQLSSLYWLNIIAGVIVFILLLISTPFVVIFYEEQRLTELMPWAALVFLVTPLGQQFQILLQKNLQFRILSIIEITAVTVGTTVAIITAMMGEGVFSIIWGQLGNTLIKTLMLAGIGWKRWPPKLQFKYSDLHGYLGFGMYQMGEKTINYFINRTDQLIIGSLAGAQALGYYNLAVNLVIQPISKINPILGRVAFPLFAKVQYDNDRLKRGYFYILKLLSIINFPILFGLAIVAPTLVPLLFGEQWLPAIVLVQILSFVALLRSNGNPIASLYLAKGRADLGFKWNVMVFPTQIIGLYLGHHYLGGVLGVAVALLILQITYSILNYIVLIRTLLGSCLKEYIMSIAPSFGLSLLMALMVAIVPVAMNQPNSMILTLQIFVGAIVYFILNIIFRWQELQEIKSFILGK